MYTQPLISTLAGANKLHPLPTSPLPPLSNIRFWNVSADRNVLISLVFFFKCPRKYSHTVSSQEWPLPLLNWWNSFRQLTPKSDAWLQHIWHCSQQVPWLQKKNSERYVSPPNWCEQAAHLLAWVWGQLEHRHAAWESGAGSPGRTAGSGSPCSGHSGPWSATQTAACDRQCYALRFLFLTSVQDSGIYAFGKASMHSHVSLTLPLKQC